MRIASEATRQRIITRCVTTIPPLLKQKSLVVQPLVVHRGKLVVELELMKRSRLVEKGASAPFSPVFLVQIEAVFFRGRLGNQRAGVNRVESVIVGRDLRYPFAVRRRVNPLSK